jgi:YesN/AraC family two-component response regulator
MRRPSRARQVLVIDDDPHVAGTVAAALEERYLVHVAADDREALVMLRRLPIDLMVLDVRLKTADGLAALERLRAARNCRVLVLTGFGSEEVLLRALRARVDDYLDKPFDVFELQARVAALMGEPPGHGDPAHRARQLLLHRHDRPHTTASLARNVGLSPSHFRRLFKAAYGCTPMELLERLRMEQAARLLKAGGLSVKEVARKVGYQNANNFSTAFKRFYGTPPQSHRPRDAVQNAL